VTDSVVSQYVRNAAESQQHAASHGQPEFTEIRRWLKAKRLIAELSYSHGVQPEKYPIVQGRDGADRIRCGSRHLNVSDFLTKELNLSWKEAAPILLGAYARQQGKTTELLPREKPRIALWQAYTVVRDAAANERRSAWSQQRDGEGMRRDEIKARFVTRRDTLRADTGLSHRQRRSELSIARMDRISHETRLRGHIQVERDTLKITHGSAAGPSFAEFLQARAQAGDALALNELHRTRSIRAEQNDKTDEENEIRAVLPLAQHNEIIFIRPALTHEVHRNGDVTYRHDGRDVVRDRGPTVQVLKMDRDAMETGLRLAQAKFGTALQLAGSEAFQREAARVAVDAGLQIRFSDDHLNRIMMDRLAERIAERYASVSDNAKPSRIVAVPAPTVDTPTVSSPPIDPPVAPAAPAPLHSDPTR